VKKSLLVVLLVLVALVVVADRAVEQVAEGVVSRQLEPELGTRPTVEIGGFPFLTQALRGRYDRIDVSAGDVTRGDVTVQDFTATLTGTRVPMSDVLAGSIEEVPVDRLRGGALVPYSALTRRGVQVEPAGDRVRLSGTLSVLGQTVDASGLADVAVDGQDLVLTAREVTAAGVTATGPLADALLPLLTVRYRVPELPYGLQLRDVDVEPGGVRVGGTASDVLLRR